jgi:hypothetical protein
MFPVMKKFELPDDLNYNRGLIQNPTTYFKETGCKSWLFLVGEEFSKMPGGISYHQVQEATADSINSQRPTENIKHRLGTTTG